MKNNIFVQFGFRIQEISQDVQQKQLKDVNGFHRTYIGMLERDGIHPAFINIDIYSNDFEVCLEELIDFTITQSSDNTHDQ